MACDFPNQITNRNFLAPSGFKFTLSKEPKVSFFCTSARIPEISLDTAVQPSYLKDLDIPGEKLTYGDLSLRFLIDEDMENYMAIHNWLTGLGFPETTQDYKDLIADPVDVTQPGDAIPVLKAYKFYGIFPTAVSAIDLSYDSTDTIEEFTVDLQVQWWDALDSAGNTQLGTDSQVLNPL